MEENKEMTDHGQEQRLRVFAERVARIARSHLDLALDLARDRVAREGASLTFHPAAALVVVDLAAPGGPHLL